MRKQSASKFSMKKTALLLLIQILFFPTLSAQTASQTIRGTVTDRNSGQPVAYATVVVMDRQRALGTTTDSLGRFSLRQVPVGRHDVEVNCLGYEPTQLREILVGSSKEVVLDVRLQEALVAVEEVVVRPTVNKTEPLNSMALAGGRMLSVEEASRYAGSMDDPARLVSAFAGVASTVGNNGIVVRGNAPKFLLWRMEGVEIPNPNHFAEVTSFGGGGLTALSSQVLGNSDFYTGAFPAEYGNALSGVFDMYLRNGNNARCEHTFQLGILGIDAASEGPFSKNYDGSYLFNYRYSTLSLLTPMLPADAEGTNYQDLSFKLAFPSRRAGTFSLWGVGLIDRSGTVAETDPAKWAYDQDMENQDVRQYMGAVGLNHVMRVGRASQWRTSLAATVSGLDMHTERMNDEVVPLPQNVIRNTDWNFVFSTALQTRLGERHTNRTGIRLTGLRYDQFLQDAPARDGALQTLTDEAGMSALMSAWSNSVIRLSPRWEAGVGLHAQWFTLNDRWTLEPRVSVKWQAAPDHSLALAYGLHSRLEMLNYYFTEVGGERVNRNLDFTKAHHLSLAWDWQIGMDRHLRVEPYVQWLYSVPVVPGTTFSFINLQGGDDWFLDERLTNDGRGLNYGVDITFERFLARGFYYMMTASLFDARYRTSGGEWFDTRYNRHYVLNVLAGKEWMTGRNRQNMLGISGRVTFQGGDRYSPIDRDASAALHTAVYDESRPFMEQFDPVLLAHLTVSYRINRRRVAHEFALKVLNLTGYRDYYGHRYNYLSGQVEPEREANIVPNISYRIEF